MEMVFTTIIIKLFTLRVFKQKFRRYIMRFIVKFFIEIYHNLTCSGLLQLCKVYLEILFPVIQVLGLFDFFKKNSAVQSGGEGLKVLFSLTLVQLVAIFIVKLFTQVYLERLIWPRLPLVCQIYVHAKCIYRVINTVVVSKGSCWFSQLQYNAPNLLTAGCYGVVFAGLSLLNSILLSFLW